MAHSQKPRFRLSAKRTSTFKPAGASVQSTTGSRGVRISGSNAGYIMFRGSAKGTGYPLNWPVSPSLPLPCVSVFHHISTVLYCCPQHKRANCVFRYSARYCCNILTKSGASRQISVYTNIMPALFNSIQGVSKVGSVPRNHRNWVNRVQKNLRTH